MTAPHVSIRDDLAAAGLMPRAMPDHSSVNSRGEGVDPTSTRHTSTLDPETEDFLGAGGWSMVSIKDGADRNGGMTSHRGVIHPGEYVDTDFLARAVAGRLGFPLEDIRAAYKQGRKSGAQTELRSTVDALILEVAETGGLLVELGRALGWEVREDGHCRTIENALARARAARAEAEAVAA